MTPEGRLTAVQSRALLDAWLMGSAIFWERRARAFEDAMPRPDDFTGQATPEQLDARARRCVAAAQACRHRATGLDGVAVADLVDTLHDVAAGAAA